MMGQLRLDKFLADAGYGTRKSVKEIIRKQRVKLNGEICRSSDVHINTEIDIVIVDGKAVSYEALQYYMLNKPRGVVSATEDKNCKTVIELLDEKKRRDLFPVGRLDKDTVGLLLITNDGIMSNSLLAPGKHVEKRYLAVVNGKVNRGIISEFGSGIDIGDDKITNPAKLEIVQDKDIIVELRLEEFLNEEQLRYFDRGEYSLVEIAITEGRYHQIKRMFGEFKLEVLFLKRLSVGRLELDETLDYGEYRKLTIDEIKLLKA